MNAQPSVSATSWFSLPAVVTCTPEVADGPIVIAFAVSAGFTALVVISAHGAPLGLGVLRLPRALRPRAADRPLDGVAPAVVEMDGVGVGQGLRPGDVPAGAPLAVEPGPPERERRQRRGDEDQVDPIPRRHAASPRQSRWWKLPAWCTVDSATSRPVRFTSPLIVASPAA